MIFGKKHSVDTSSEKIQEILDRGVEHIYPNKDFLKSKLNEGSPVTLYLGIDPTGPTLHIGHAINLLKLRKFQELGHKIILLIGDFTGMIGDPTDKSATRKRLTRDEVLENAKLYKSQASKFLKFSGPNPAELKYNSSWLSKMRFEDVVELMSQMTVDQMLKRDMFQKRIEENKPIHIHEFIYPLMQGYDSVAMNVDGEIGGNDQTFNMLAGRTLMKNMLNKEKFVITMKLLVDQEGKKMGKTDGNMISFLDDEHDMFGKVMSWTDGMIVSGFELATEIPVSEIEKIKQALAGGKNPKDIKMHLAREIVSTYHGPEAAKKAEENFVNTFNKGELPENVSEVEVASGSLLSDILLEQKIISSKSEFKRLVEEGAVTIVGTDKKITDQFEKVLESADYKIGKRRFIKIRFFGQ